MAWKLTSPMIGAQPINVNSTTQRHRLGTIVQAADPTYGVGEFIYLKGINSTVANDWVEYNDAFLSALATVAIGSGEMLAVAMAPTVTGEFGWYQISGVAINNKASDLSVAAAAGISATSGKAVAAATAVRINGCIATTVSSAVASRVTLTVVIQRPIGSAVTDVG